MPAKKYTKKHQKMFNQLYKEFIVEEPIITETLKRIVKNAGGSLVDLDSCLKDKKSLQRKMSKKINRHLITTDEELVRVFKSFSDIIRYTYIVSSFQMEEKINTLIEDLQKEGYSLVKIDNKFANPKEDTHYKGVHLDFMSPRHLVFEIQVHTLESYLAKNSMHDYYKITRDMSNKYSKKEKLNARLIQKRVFDMLTDIPVFYQSHSIV